MLLKRPMLGWGSPGLTVERRWVLGGGGWGRRRLQHLASSSAPIVAGSPSADGADVYKTQSNPPTQELS